MANITGRVNPWGESVRWEPGRNDMPRDVALWTGRIRYTDFSTQFTFQGIDEQEPQDLEDFVSEHGPVATPEVMDIYGVHREKAVESLQNLAGAPSFEIGGELFWDL